jgi:hypothetical protein
MSALRSILCSLAILACLVSTSYIETAAAAAVGKVTKVQKQAQIGSRKAVAGTSVNMNDRLRTGPGARLQITFVDGTLLTLGENAVVVVDRYVFDPAKGSGKMALSSTQGAFRFATGKLNQMKDKDVTVTTPHGALAVRGTEFWSGPIDGHYGTYVMKGRVDARNRARAVTISPGQGIDYRRRRRR